MSIFQPEVLKYLRIKELSKVSFDNAGYVEDSQLLTNELGLEVLKYVCHLCKKIFNDKSSFLLKCPHYRSFNRSDQCFICDSCGTAFKYKFTLESHMVKHRRNARYYAKNPKYNCKRCSRLFTTKLEFDLHSREHEGYIMRPRQSEHKCNFCRFSTNKKHSLASHLSRIHSEDVGKFKCSFCAQTFSSEPKFKSHETYHKMKLEAKDIKCEVCGVNIKTKPYLAHHMKTHLKKELACPFVNCSSKFSFSQSLRRHIRTIHEGIVKEYKCRVTNCFLTFKDCTIRLYHESKMHAVDSCFSKKKIK